MPFLRPSGAISCRILPSAKQAGQALRRAPHQIPHKSPALPDFYTSARAAAARPRPLHPRAPSLALWAIHLVLRLRRVNHMCSSTVSDTANTRIHERTQCVSAEEKILCRSPFSQRSHVGNLRQIRKQGKGRSSKRKENRRLSFLFAPAAGAANPRAPQSATPR